jgi:hypothetical protein
VAEDIAMHLHGARRVDGGLQVAVDAFLESQCAAGRAFAGELAWLGDTVVDVAGSWLHLDGALLGRPGGETAE